MQVIYGACICVCASRVSSVAVSRTMPCTLVPGRGTASSTELTVTAASTAAYRSVWLWAWAEMVNRHKKALYSFSHYSKLLNFSDKLGNLQLTFVKGMLCRNCLYTFKGIRFSYVFSHWILVWGHLNLTPVEFEALSCNVRVVYTICTQYMDWNM